MLMEMCSAALISGQLFVLLLLYYQVLGRAPNLHRLVYRPMFPLSIDLGLSFITP